MIGVYKTISEKYGDSINYHYHHFPLSFNKNAQKAAESLECMADQNPKNVHDVIVASYAKYKNNDFDYDGFLQIAADNGYDTEAVKACVNAGTHTQKVTRQMETGKKVFNIAGVPGNVLIHNATGKYVILPGAYPATSFEAEIDKMLGQGSKINENELKEDIFTEKQGNQFLVKDNKLYYKSSIYKNGVPTIKFSELMNVDIPSFQIIDFPYAKDKNNVYFQSETIIGANPNTFSIIENTSKKYSKDDSNVYYKYFGKIRIMRGVDLESFEVLSSGKTPAIDSDYAKDKYNAWYKGLIIKKKNESGEATSVDSDSFEVIFEKPRFSKDKDTIYWMQDSLPGCTMEGLFQENISSECK